MFSIPAPKPAELLIVKPGDITPDGPKALRLIVCEPQSRQGWCKYKDRQTIISERRFNELVDEEARTIVEIYVRHARTYNLYNDSESLVSTSNDISGDADRTSAIRKPQIWRDPSNEMGTNTHYQQLVSIALLVKVTHGADTRNNGIARSPVQYTHTDHRHCRAPQLEPG